MRAAQCECDFVHMYICMSHIVCAAYFFFFCVCVCLTVLTARESILEAIGIVTSVGFCVSVSGRRFDWPSEARRRATSPLFL